MKRSWLFVSLVTLITLAKLTNAQVGCNPYSIFASLSQRKVYRQHYSTAPLTRGVISSYSTILANSQYSRQLLSERSFSSPECGQINKVSASPSGSVAIAKTLARGAFLRIASDLSGGTPLESIKVRVTATKDGPRQALRKVIREGGVGALWAGTPARTIEGALLGAIFLATSSGTKNFVLSNGGSRTLAAVCGGFLGGIAQTLVMTPSGMVFTSLTVNSNMPGNNDSTAFLATKRIVREKGFAGLFAGGKPMAMRQASNWVSRAGLTEFARTRLRMSDYALWGELGSGIVAGLGSCWNTPIETVRVLTQRDVSRGITPKSFGQYASDIMQQEGFRGLYRGLTPRAMQAVWQTTFMVAVPNVLGL